MIILVVLFSCPLHEKMMWLDLSWALARVSSMPGVTHIITWLTFICSVVILSSSLYLARKHPAPSSFRVVVHAHTCASGIHGSLLIAAACKMMLYHSSVMRPLLTLREKKKNPSLAFPLGNLQQSFLEADTFLFKLVILSFPLCARNSTSSSEHRDEYD